MNRLEIIAPRWHDRTLLLADWKIGKVNQIVVKHHEYPEPFYATGDELRKFPVEEIKSKAGHMIPMRVVPLSALTTTEIIEDL